MPSPATPVIVGVGDIVNRTAAALEPLELMQRAAKSALRDAAGPHEEARSGLRAGIDSVSVVRTWTWPYGDLPGLLWDRLRPSSPSPSPSPAAAGAEEQQQQQKRKGLRHAEYSAHGGNQPARMLDEAARRIARGEATVALVTGGEALASLTACAKAGKLPPPGWTKPAEAVDGVFSPTGRDLGDNLGAVHSIGAPIHVYPLYENGFRAHRGQSIRDNNRESAALYGEFARVAAGNEYAWNYGKAPESEEAIGTVTERNRMICFPYPLLMNAFNTVNLAAACILTSTEHARKLGIPESKWIYPLGGAGTKDSDEFWKRPNFYSSPSISESLDAALRVSGLRRDQIDLFDLYSCFPIVPKLAAKHLGLPITKSQRPLTLLGGLTSFGGAGNNYSMHAITEMVRQLRAGKGRYGLVLANGGVLSYQHVVCLSTRQRSDVESGGNNPPYPQRNPLPEVITDVPVPTIEAHCEGEAIVETYTVEFNRDNTPLRGFVVGRLKCNGHRFLANHGNALTLRQLASDAIEPIGRSGWVRRDTDSSSRRNLFSFERESSL